MNFQEFYLKFENFQPSVNPRKLLSRRFLVTQDLVDLAQLLGELSGHQLPPVVPLELPQPHQLLVNPQVSLVLVNLNSSSSNNKFKHCRPMKSFPNRFSTFRSLAMNATRLSPDGIICKRYSAQERLFTRSRSHQSTSTLKITSAGSRPWDTVVYLAKTTKWASSL